MKLIKTNKLAWYWGWEGRRQGPGIELGGDGIEYKVKTFIFAKGRLNIQFCPIRPEGGIDSFHFFRWTQTRCKARAMCSSTVQRELGYWSAWAFPQEAAHGMMPGNWHVQKIQRSPERFAFCNAEPSNDCSTVGTAHHPLGCSAFHIPQRTNAMSGIQVVCI